MILLLGIGGNQGGESFESARVRKYLLKTY